MTKPVPSLVLLTGPAAAGKTAVAGSWATRQEHPAASVSLDNIRDQLKSGYVNPEDGWNPVAEGQYHLARHLAAAMGKAYWAAGYSCIIDDAIFPNWPAVSYEGWQEELGDTPHALVVLLPSFQAVVNRNAGHSGHRHLRQETLRTIHRGMLGWRRRGFPIIDNTFLTVDETAQQLERVLRSAFVDNAFVCEERP